VDAGIFFGGISVQVGTYQLQPVKDLVGAAALGFFKQQVFNKMSQALLVGCSSREPAFTKKQQWVTAEGSIFVHYPDAVG
jgi:hypothetical protein